jgi:hypothetical protein
LGIRIRGELIEDAARIQGKLTLATGCDASIAASAGSTARNFLPASATA